MVNFIKPKARLDKLMGSPAPWVIHDLRRTVRTHLAKLRISDRVAEMVIGHGAKGLQRLRSALLPAGDARGAGTVGSSLARHRQSATRQCCQSLKEALTDLPQASASCAHFESQPTG